MGGVGVALYDDLLGAQFGGAVEIDRVDGLVGRQVDDLLHAGVDGRVDDVLGAEHARAHRFEGVVLARRHLLHGRGVNDDVGALGGAGHAPPVSDVADQIPQVGFRV